MMTKDISQLLVGERIIHLEDEENERTLIERVVRKSGGNYEGFSALASFYARAQFENGIYVLDNEIDGECRAVEAAGELIEQKGVPPQNVFVWSGTIHALAIDDLCTLGMKHSHILEKSGNPYDLLEAISSRHKNTEFSYERYAPN